VSWDRKSPQPSCDEFGILATEVAAAVGEEETGVEVIVKEMYKRMMKEEE
jgi:hypothetical protein